MTAVARSAVARAAIATGLIVTCLSLSAGRTEPAVFRLRIPTQPLDAALLELAHQTGFQVLVFSDLAGSSLSGELDGTYTIDGALTVILSRSKLTYWFVNPKTVKVVGKGSGLRSTP